MIPVMRSARMTTPPTAPPTMGPMWDVAGTAVALAEEVEVVLLVPLKVPLASM